MRKILVSDYDQTFYLNDEDIEKNKKSVENFRKQENIFIFATGRSYFDFMNKAEQYKLKWDYLIINHGATILDKNNNIISNYTIDNDVIKNIKKDLLRREPNDSMIKFEYAKNLLNISKGNVAEVKQLLIQLINKKFVCTNS